MSLKCFCMYMDNLIIGFRTKLVLGGQDWMDPMRVIDGHDDVTGRDHVAKHYGIIELFDILQTGFIVVCVCSLLISLIALLFVNKSEMIADKKADILHKLGIVFIISSFATILGIISALVKVAF